MIWVIMPQSLKNSFKSQIFNIDEFDTFENLSNQCTDQNYIKLLNIYKSKYNKDNKDKDREKLNELKSELKAILKRRYDIFTYDRFAKYIKDNYTNKIVENKVIIIDEAHNIRSTNKKVKDTYLALTKCLKAGVNNRLILLSATPMYNEPRDILELLKLLLINDKRNNIISDNKKIFNNNKAFNIDDPNVITLIKKTNINEIDKDKFSSFLHKVFRSPRKKINKVFSREILASCKIDENLRPENLNSEQIIKLYKLE